MTHQSKNKSSAVRFMVQCLQTFLFSILYIYCGQVLAWIYLALQNIHAARDSTSLDAWRKRIRPLCFHITSYRSFQRALIWSFPMKARWSFKWACVALTLSNKSERSQCFWMCQNAHERKINYFIYLFYFMVLYLTCLLANPVVISRTNKLSKQMRCSIIEKKPGPNICLWKMFFRVRWYGSVVDFYTLNSFCNNKLIFISAELTL